MTMMRWMRGGRDFCLGQRTGRGGEGKVLAGSGDRECFFYVFDDERYQEVGWIDGWMDERKIDDGMENRGGGVIWACLSLNRIC